MSECDDSNIDCSKPQCRNKCGWIQWFGNLSDCTVILQYQDSQGGLWHSLGEYAPGQKTELGGGVILLPQNVNIRAIKKPELTDEGSVQVVLNWGRLGESSPSLFVSAQRCSSAQDTTTQVSIPSAGTAETAGTAGTAQETSKGKFQVNWTVWIIVCLLVGVALSLSIATYLHLRKPVPYSLSAQPLSREL
jgi:hypothetical protein